jgi:hypothetical protein
VVIWKPLLDRTLWVLVIVAGAIVGVALILAQRFYDSRGPSRDHQPRAECLECHQSDNQARHP